jgi:glutamate dehydrogenase
VELLFSLDVDQIVNLLEELATDADKHSVQIVVRTHPRGRMFYAAVLMPRAHYREGLRSGIRRLLEDQTGATYIDDRTSFIDEETAVVHCFCTTGENRSLEPDEVRLEEAMRTICSPWEDRFLAALCRNEDEERAQELAARYETVFPEVLRWQTHPVDAVRDVEAIERLHETGEPQFALYFDEDDPTRDTATLRLYLPEAPLLSDLLPTIDRFDLRVVDAQLVPVRPTGRSEVAVESLRILPLGTEQADLDAIFGRLSSALRATLSGDTSSDSLDGLVLGAGLDWRQVDLVRTYLEYFVQIQGTLSRPFLRRVMLGNPIAVRLIVRLFEARHDPSLCDEVRSAREEQLRCDFESYRERISTLNEDRALAGLCNLVDATLRANYFAPSSSPHRVALKLDSSRIAELAGVVPYCEIFVHSAQMTGIHLRGGPVARGGLRWSDRHDDLRFEILDLMRTQMLKNGLIVPVGAKGGFVLRASGLSPSEAREKADEQYRVFISSLLDLTDNLAPDGTLIPPKDVRRLDGDDPYLVVAADKGTAHLSDTANEIALDRDFWLGDAFASGGSNGYDHKKYGITARGAWECVKHHFGELGIDPERDSYSVVGIGDMSGDVFGNGLLLMRRAKLVAAFDHRHVFLDPDPDPERSWKERKRLFEQPGSSWADFSPACFSEGGGVWPRSSKSIPLSPALRERLGIEGGHASGQQILSAILRLQVDLFWNGGVGTYVRATRESNAEVGDRANDAIRIPAGELRARVVGEGGNLGFTQAARVEASMNGVRIDTDAIDNSAGVDLSDHEVNYKVALEPHVRAGELSAEERRRILIDAADVACGKVLHHNRRQALALSIDELRSVRDPEIFQRAIEDLCAAAGYDPAELELPDAAALADRGLHRGLARPELAVLLGLAKLHVQAELAGSELPLCDYIDPIYQSYFPKAFVGRFPDALESHRLRREIGALGLVNRLVDVGGATLFVALTAELGVGVAEAAAALVMAEDLFDIPELRSRLLETPSGRDGIYRVLLELDEGVRGVTRYLVRSRAGALEQDRVESLRAGVDVLRRGLYDYLSGPELQRLEERQARLEQEGISKDLALDIASLPLADRGLNILRACMETQGEAIDVAGVYAMLGDQTGINRALARLTASKHESLWDRMVLADLRWDLLDLHFAITTDVLSRPCESREQGVGQFLAEHADVVASVQELERRAGTEAGPSALSVIAGRLSSLRS